MVAVVNAKRLSRPRRVYYILPLLMATLIPAASGAQNERTADPGMTKGPAQAPVTIVEFSDYQ
jgi:hypothetical protein